MSDKKFVNTILIDDSLQARKLLRLMLHDMAPDLRIVAEAENVDEALQFIRQYSPDVLFLDIEMPGKSGLQLAELLVAENYTGTIVFTTAYNSYAIKAFRLSALDYLLKPIQEEHLLEAIAKIREYQQNKENQKRLVALTENLKTDQREVLCVPIQGGFDYIPVAEIEYLEADGSYVQLFCSNNRSKTFSKNLKYFENALSGCASFFRPHRSFIVNLDYVTNYSRSEGGFLVLKRNIQIPVSRERKQAIQDIFK